MKIYHNTRCKKSRAGLAYLQEKGLDFEIIEYLKNPLSEGDLKELLMLLNEKPENIIRKQEALFRTELKGKNFTDDEWVKIIVKNPKLIQRPIVVNKHKAVIAQPPELIDTIL